jgi:hypothetical protein
METILLPHSGKEVRIPSTGNDWELYSTMKCGSAARALTSALKKAVVVVDKAAKDGFRPTEEGLYELYEKFAGPVCQKYSEFGASDTEPRSHFIMALESVVEVVTGSRF